MEQKPVYRHEDKYLISPSDRILLASRLRTLMTPDANASSDGTYRIRSVYFDDPFDSAFHDSLGGVYKKQKYRIRMYDNNRANIFLEKKVKTDSVGQKFRVRITADEAEDILSGHYDFLLQKDNPLCKDFYAALRSALRPVTVVDYRRTAFFSPGDNIRITIDDDIRSCKFSDNFFKTEPDGIPSAENGTCVLEIKYNKHLPDHIKKLINVRDLFRSGFSKYTKSRQII